MGEKENTREDVAMMGDRCASRRVRDNTIVVVEQTCKCSRRVLFRSWNRTLRDRKSVV